jgi:hypothetical protein
MHKVIFFVQEKRGLARGGWGKSCGQGFFNIIDYIFNVTLLVIKIIIFFTETIVMKKLFL